AFDKLPPPGPDVPRPIVLSTVASVYQTDPEKVLANLVRPPLLLPIHPLMQPIYRLAQAPERVTTEGVLKPKFQPLILELWTSDWSNLSITIRQQIANQLQRESEFFTVAGFSRCWKATSPAQRSDSNKRRAKRRKAGACPTSYTSTPTTTSK